MVTQHLGAMICYSMLYRAAKPGRPAFIVDLFSQITESNTDLKSVTAVMDVQIMLIKQAAQVKC